MARRTRAQRTGEIGEDVVRQIISNHPNWIVRNQDKDYGIDLEAELAAPAEGEQVLAGKLIKIQVKASEGRQSRHRKLAVPLDRGYLDYVAQFRLPVILVAVDVTRKEAWFAWLQQWLLENEIRLASRSTPAAPTIHIAKDHTLSAGLDGVLQRIARGEDRTAMVLALRELALAATTTSNSIVFDGVLDLLAKVDEPSRAWTIQKIIDALVGLGPNVGVWQTSQVLTHLTSVIDRFGDTVTEEQIVRLVARGDTYSRTGLGALSRLFDRWPNHARSLGLPRLFRSLGLKVVAWYCDLRLTHPELDSIGLWGALGSRRLTDIRFGGVVLSNSPEIADFILRTWPNRGDSVFIDCLFLDR